MEAMLARAREGYPCEVCGVLLGPASPSVRVDSVVSVVNREKDQPRVRYQIAPEDLIRIQREARDRGQEIVGYFHSHPYYLRAALRDSDRRIAAEGLSDGVIHVVVGVEKGERAVPTAWIFRDATQVFDEEPLEIE